VVGFVENADGDQGQRGRVDQCRQDSRAMVPVSLFLVGRLRCQPQSPPGKRQRQHIREVMRGIGQQRQGIGNQPRCDLDKDKD